MMVGETPRWVTYEETASLLGLPLEAAKRLVLRSGWPRRPDSAGGTQVAIPEHLMIHDDEVEADLARGESRSLREYLELRVEQLTEELADVRTEMRGVRFEAESLRIDAGRAQVFAALVEAERARTAEVRAERDCLAEELSLYRRPWLVRWIGSLISRPPARRRPF